MRKMNPNKDTFMTLSELLQLLMNLSILNELWCPYWTIMSLLNFENKKNWTTALSINTVIDCITNG